MVTDQQLIASVLAGDSAPFSELVARYQKRIFGLLWQLCGDRELAEDLTQETFLRAFQKLQLYSGESFFFAWLARIAIHLHASFRRKRVLENLATRRNLDPDMDPLARRAEPSRQVELSELQQAVRHAVSMLDEDRRVVLLLRDFEDLNYQQIASILGIPTGTVRSRLHRARLEVKQFIESMAPHSGFPEGL